MADGQAVVDAVRSKMISTLEASHCEVSDLSDGCGAKLDMIVVSAKFDGMSLIDRQRAVHEALEEEMKTIHALTMKCKTPAQWEKMQSAS
eukprot:CAMPEP_0184303832 /NCGR_PEP_ID=MMETSP1049-20130417/13505_1 /TAXON_ID=77928 /ORGANISM="Proteomonas sulcata, Strain CCMP704" /LENGTH=89 /DNA_ID=CAMNT_0026615499 /DNA_START=77 /DNA_END=346 /DNA_ORIENTATION=+